MWLDWDPPEDQFEDIPLHSHFKPFLRFDETLWNDIITKMSQVGMNMLVLDLGDGVRYRSHPEIAVENAWSVEKLKMELTKLRDLGLEPIPKMNFSTWHDAWLGKYEKMVSSDIYYTVCSDLITEGCDIFDKPRFFHLGMDEEYEAEIEEMEQHYKYQFTRKPNIYWHDLYFFLGQVEKSGSRPWTFFDERNPGGAEAIYRKFPKSVALTAWNFEVLVDYCIDNVNPEYLLGFMMAPWQPTLESCRRQHMEAIQQVAKAIDKFS